MEFLMQWGPIPTAPPSISTQIEKKIHALKANNTDKANNRSLYTATKWAFDV